MTAAEQEALCRHYDLGHPSGYEKAGGTRNANCLLHTSRGAWFVRRRYPGYSAPARVAFDHRAIEFLRSRDVSVAAPRKSTSGESFWTYDNGVWEVFPALSGRHLRDGDEADVRRLAKALTQLHCAARSFGERFEKLGPRGETDPAELLMMARTMGEQAPDCIEALKPYVNWIDAAQRKLNDAQFCALPHTLVHGDVQPANVLVDGDRVSFVDFDWCAWRARIYDLAFAILLCCSKHATPFRGEDIWSISQPVSVQSDLLRCFLQACADAGWPLNSDELAALPPQLMLSWCSCRICGAAKVDASRRREFLSRPPHDLQSLCADLVS